MKGRQADCSLALTCLAKICTEEFGKDLSQHVYELLKSSRPYIRKKAILAMYKISLVYPEVLVTLLPKLLEALSDDYLSVVCAAVTVLCELARRSPKDVAMFGPPLINLLEDSRNNWIRIKVVKLLGWLCREKPALAESLVNPISKLMNKTEAKSLMYECCNTITVGMTKYYSVVELAAGKLGEFITDSDQNLVVLGLLALTRLGKTYPNVIQKHRDMVLNCFEDEDVGIRSCALDLITCFIKKNNFREVSKILRRKLSKALEVSIYVYNFFWGEGPPLCFSPFGTDEETVENRHRVGQLWPPFFLSGGILKPGSASLGMNILSTSVSPIFHRERIRNDQCRGYLTSKATFFSLLPSGYWTLESSNKRLQTHQEGISSCLLSPTLRGTSRMFCSGSWRR